MHDKRVHGGITLSSVIQDPKPSETETTEELSVAQNMNVDVLKMGTAVASPGFKPCVDLSDYEALSDVGIPSTSASVPEGRVHGGSLMAMLAGGSGFGSNSGLKSFTCDPSESSNAQVVPERWM